MRGEQIVLIGFMGTGKTAVGSRLAERLGWEFADADGLIEAEAGMPIHRLFAERGEAHFRALENAVVARLVARDRVVIATGGGAFADAENRRRLTARGTVVCLAADPETILARVGDARSRPLLDGPDPHGRIRELLAARAPIYALADVTVDTSCLSVEGVVDEILGALRRPAPARG